jgi:stringent starvation protein B
MTSNKPYLVRAMNEWILENQMTPYLLVDANVEGVEVPEQYVKDGKIVLNVKPSAVQEITFENEWIYFSARFGGQPFLINVPINAVLAIYARENDRGMMFAADESLVEDNTTVEEKESDNKDHSNIQREEQDVRKKPVLTVVK